MAKETPQYLPGIIMSGGANLLGMVASLVTIMIAARLLSQDELGAFFLVMLVAQFTALLGDIGLKNTAIRALSSLPVASSAFIQTARYLLTVTLVTSLVACLVVNHSMPFLTMLWPYQAFQAHAKYIAPIAFLTTGLQVVMSLLVGAKEFRTLSVLSAGVEIGRAILSTGGLLSGLGISALLWGIIVSRLIGIGAIWASMPSLFVLTFWHPERAALLKFGGWLYGCSLVSILMVRASDVILTTYMGTAALAVYSAAIQVPSVLQRGFESIRPALLGYVSAQQTADTNSQLAAVRLVTASLAVAATFLLVLSSPLMSVLYSDKYESGVKIMQVLSVWAAFSIVNYLFSIILIGTGQSRQAFVLTVPQLLMTVISTWMLVPGYEGFGAAIGLLTTAFLGNVLGAWLIAKGNISSWYGLTMVFLRAAVPLLLLLLAVLLTKPSVLVLIAYTSLTIAMLIAFKVITSDDITILRLVTSGIAWRVAVSPIKAQSL
jgi:O-antigen/teichoic acid export membrane protein